MLLIWLTFITEAFFSVLITSFTNKFYALMIFVTIRINDYKGNTGDTSKDISKNRSFFVKSEPSLKALFNKRN